MERDFVKSCGKKNIWHLNLDENITLILKKVKQICCRIQFFMSYARVDRNLALQLGKALKNKDFGVWCENDLDFTTSINNKIKEIAEKGFVILLLTKNSLDSTFVNTEAKLAILNNAKLFFLFLTMY